MTRPHFIEILKILTKYLFEVGVQLIDFSITVASITLRFYCNAIFVMREISILLHMLTHDILLCNMKHELYLHEAMMCYIMIIIVVGFI